jgi:ABC-2 type transport system permease protein
MIALIQGEMIKVRTTRTALGFAAATFLLVLAVVLISILAGDPSDVDSKRDALNTGGVMGVTLLLFGIVGASGEYRHRTIAPAVLIAPDRFRLSLARLLAYVITAIAVAIAMAALAVVLGALLLPSTDGPDLAGSDYVRVVVGAIIAAALSAALGVGVGILIRNQVAGVVGALVWILILAPLLGLIDEDIPAYTNADAAGTVGGSEGEVLSWGGAIAVLFAWAAVFVVIGLLVDRRHDVD